DGGFLVGLRADFVPGVDALSLEGVDAPAVVFLVRVGLQPDQGGERLEPREEGFFYGVDADRRGRRRRRDRRNGRGRGCFGGGDGFGGRGRLWGVGAEEVSAAQAGE